MNTLLSTNTSRRQFIHRTALAAAGACLYTDDLLAAPASPVITIRGAAASEPVTITKLRGGISVLAGSGGNIAAIATPSGGVLIDAGITASQPRIRKALKELGIDQVTCVINTHWHFDHTDGNEWLHRSGARIIAHENTRKHLAALTPVEDWNFTFPPSPLGALPTETIREDLTLHLSDTTIRLEHFRPAHTDSDLSAHFPEANVLHVGDTWWNGYYPFIDRQTGGSIDGMISAVKSILDRVNDDTIIIPGHGKVGTKAQLAQFHGMLLESREKVHALKESGASKEAVIAARPTAAYDEQFGKFVIDGKTFTHLVYSTLP